MAQGYTEQCRELRKKWRKLHTHGFQICRKGSDPTGSRGDPGTYRMAGTIYSTLGESFLWKLMVTPKANIIESKYKTPR